MKKGKLRKSSPRIREDFVWVPWKGKKNKSSSCKQKKKENWRKWGSNKLRTQRKSMFFLRKLNFKLRACNHHIKGLPFFRRPLVCCVDAREVFSIRFPCFFSWSGKLTYNRLNTRCSLERSIAANCIYQKHSTGLFTLCDLIKTHSRWECVSDCMWYKRTVSSE